MPMKGHKAPMGSISKIIIYKSGGSYLSLAFGAFQLQGQTAKKAELKLFSKNFTACFSESIPTIFPVYGISA